MLNVYFTPNKLLGNLHLWIHEYYERKKVYPSSKVQNMYTISD